jgi:MoaA/NifB/PqqE/SkfB family radical SAM enzyme
MKKFFRPFISLTYNCNFSCKHCYARGLEKTFPDYMDFEKFKKLIEWFKKQEISHITITGGEPTTHPDFLKIIALCHKEKIHVTLLTNCLFDDSIIEKLKNKKLIIKADYFPSSLKNFDHKKYNYNLDKIFESKIIVGFICRLPINRKDYPDIVKKAKKYNSVIMGRYLMTGPNEKSIDIKKRIREMRSILDFAELIKKEKLTFVTQDFLLRCAFTEKEWKSLESFNKKGGNKIAYSKCYGGEYSPILEQEVGYASKLNINPDLSIFPCFPVFFKGPNILSFKNIEEIEDLLKPFFNKWKWEVPLMKKCEKCKYFIEKKCQGGCLHYKQHKYYKENIVDIKEVI